MIYLSYDKKQRLPTVKTFWTSILISFKNTRSQSMM